MKATLGIIGGSGFYQMDTISNKQWINLSTPFGKPSDPFLVGKVGKTSVAFLARHGRGHHLLPSEINYRANIYGMKKLGVEWIVAASAVGSLKEELKPLDFVIPNQLVDRTTKRHSTFFGDGIAAHISFAEPFCESLRQTLLKTCHELKITAHDGGTYLNMEGPAFSTRAESNLYRSWGMDIIGMTNLVEAKLAREAQICYATLAMVTDYDCWHRDHDAVTVEAIIENLIKNTKNATHVVEQLSAKLPKTCEHRCRRALQNAIITSQDKIPASAKKKLKLLFSAS